MTPRAMPPAQRGLRGSRFPAQAVEVGIPACRRSVWELT